MLRAADHLADLFGKLSIVFSEPEEEAVRGLILRANGGGDGCTGCIGSCGTD